MFQSWLSQNAKGLSVCSPLVIANGAESEIAGQGKKRNAREDRHSLFFYYKQKRMLGDKWNAMINMIKH